MSKEVYRSAASVLVLRPVSREGNVAQYQILLLHKPRRKDAWQLPQGGREEGENTEQAALRELCEEAGLSGVECLGKSELYYQYDFPPSYRRFRPDHVRGQKIEFISALAPAGAEIAVDGKEIDKYVWVYPENVQQYLKRGEYLRLTMALFEEAKTFLDARAMR